MPVEPPATVEPQFPLHAVTPHGGNNVGYARACVCRILATQIKCDKVDTGAFAFLFSPGGDIITTSCGFRAGWHSSKKQKDIATEELKNHGNRDGMLEKHKEIATEELQNNGNRDGQITK